jgi:hypothetical protein
VVNQGEGEVGLRFGVGGVVVSGNPVRCRD